MMTKIAKYIDVLPMIKAVETTLVYCLGVSEIRRATIYQHIADHLSIKIALGFINYIF